jgi:hypothetical protein
MNAKNITDAVGIHKYYADQILHIMRTIKATPIVWQDVLDEKVPVSIDNDRWMTSDVEHVCV